MQIYELKLTELPNAYDVLKELYISLEYEQFEDYVYAMSREGYKIFALYERGELITYAGIRVDINLYFRRHLHIFELITKPTYDAEHFNAQMLIYLNDYAKMFACERLVLSEHLDTKELQDFYKTSGFLHVNRLLSKELV